jgi:hypothetical protein
MTDLQAFHIGDLLSVSTGALVSPDGIGGVYKILNYLTGDNLMTHQLPLACDAIRPDLLKQHPWLESITAPKFDGDEARVKAWVEEQGAEYGLWHPLNPVPESWGQHDPIADLLNMKPDARVIVVEVPDGESP